MPGGFAGGLSRGIADMQQMQLLKEYRDQNKATNALQAKLLQKKLDAQNTLQELMGGGPTTPGLDDPSMVPAGPPPEPPLFPTGVADIDSPPTAQPEAPDIADILAAHPLLALQAGYATPTSMQAERDRTAGEELIAQILPGLGIDGDLTAGGGTPVSTAPPDFAAGEQLVGGGAAPPDLAAGGQLVGGVDAPPDFAAGEQLGESIQVGKLTPYVDVDIDPLTSSIKFKIKNPTTTVIEDQMHNGKRGKMLIDSKRGTPIRFFPATDFQQVTDADGSVSFVDVNALPGGTELKPAAREIILPPDKVMNYRNVNAEPVPMNLRASSSDELNKQGYLPANKAQIDAMDSAHEMNTLVTGLRDLWIQAEKDPELYTHFEKGIQWSEGDRPLFTFPKFEEKTDWKDVFVSKWWKGVNRRLDIIYKSDPKLGLYVDRYITSAVRIARAMGEVGAMTEGDISRAMRNLANPGLSLDELGNIQAFGSTYRDSPRVAEEKFQALVDQAWQAGPIVSWRKQFGGDPQPGAQTTGADVGFTKAEIAAEMQRRGLSK